MARTLAQIYAAIIADKDDQTSLQALVPNVDSQQQLITDMNSTSKVAVWRLLAYIVATAIWTHEVLFDLYSKEIDDKIANGIWGTARWYQTQSFLFQYGDSLVYNQVKQRYEYPVIDTAKQIIKRCSIVESQNGLLLIKVAKFAQNPIPLSQPEKAAFTSYMQKIHFAGTWFQVITGNGDLLRIQYTIVYDPIIPFAILQPKVISAINNYISNLAFDGVFRVVNLIDAIQSVEGVVDVIVPNDSVKTRLSTIAPFSVIVANHKPYYGYFRIDSTAGNTLNDTLNFITI
jgi:hypothetical protein